MEVKKYIDNSISKYFSEIINKSKFPQLEEIFDNEFDKSVLLYWNSIKEKSKENQKKQDDFFSEFTSLWLSYIKLNEF